MIWLFPISIILSLLTMLLSQEIQKMYVYFSNQFMKQLIVTFFSGLVISPMFTFLLFWIEIYPLIFGD
jgi:ACR3 family arsenite efflux pump ArsB